MKIFFKLFLPVLFLFISGYKLLAQGEEQIKAGVTKVYEMFSSGEFAHLSDYIDENMVDHSPFPGQKPGLAGLKEAFELLRKAYPDLKFVMNDIIVNSAGTKASVLFTFTGTNKGEMMGMKPTGKPVNIQGIDYLYFNKEGKATEHWGYVDTDAMMQQLGMTPQGDKK